MSSPTLVNLPQELLLEICFFYCATPKDVFHISQICKTFYILSQHCVLWSRLKRFSPMICLLKYFDPGSPIYEKLYSAKYPTEMHTVSENACVDSSPYQSPQDYISMVKYLRKIEKQRNVKAKIHEFFNRWAEVFLFVMLGFFLLCLFTLLILIMLHMSKFLVEDINVVFYPFYVALGGLAIVIFMAYLDESAKANPKENLVYLVMVFIWTVLYFLVRQVHREIICYVTQERQPWWSLIFIPLVLVPLLTFLSLVSESITWQNGTISLTQQGKHFPNILGLISSLVFLIELLWLWFKLAGAVETPLWIILVPCIIVEVMIIITVRAYSLRVETDEKILLAIIASIVWFQIWLCFGVTRTFVMSPFILFLGSGVMFAVNH